MPFDSHSKMCVAIKKEFIKMLTMKDFKAVFMVAGSLW